MRIIGVSGKAGSGKDVFGYVAHDEFRAIHIAFADVLKDEVAGLFNMFRLNWESRNLYGTQEYKEKELILNTEFTQSYVGSLYVKYDEDSKAVSTYRLFLQWYGTEYRRAKDEDYWVRKLVDTCKVNPTALYVVTDMRFPNEVDIIKELGGITVRIMRSETEVICQSSFHSSETALTGVPHDVMILNRGSLKEYRENCKDWLESIMEGNGWYD